MRDKKDYIFSYKKSGVDIKLGNKVVNKIKPLVKKTHDKNVLGNIGGFGGLYKIGKLKNGVLVSATDGVGTKLLISEKLSNFNTIGIDLVAMSANDVLVQGAKPLFFLDYIAVEKIDENKVVAIVKSIVKGCKEAECSLIGGETAEMSDVYTKNTFDLAGFCVGIVEKNKILPKKNIKPNDIIFGLPSSGLHSNGFSLIRKIIVDKKLSYNEKILGNKVLGNLLLKPTKIYVKEIIKILSKCEIKGIAHITGGGIEENLSRILPVTMGATINIKKLDIYSKESIFGWLRNDCRVNVKEMLRTFNCGIGMAMIAEEKETDKLLAICKKMRQPIKILGRVNNRNFFSFI